MIRIVAPTNAWILIMGENGTGKELVARSIHYLSQRAQKPFVEVNCAAHPRGAHRERAVRPREGLLHRAPRPRSEGKFELAHEGTLFLDEVADMSLKAQAKILRILQEKKFERVGGNKFIDTDVRVLAATNKDLEKEMEAGRFRAGPLLPAQRHPAHHRAAEGPQGGHPDPGRSVRERLLPQGGGRAEGHLRGCHRHPDGSQLAGKRAGAQEYHGAPRHHDAGRHDHGRRHPVPLEGGAARGGHGLHLHPQFLPEGEDGIREEVHPEKAPGKRGQHLQDGRHHRAGAQQPPPQDQDAQPGVQERVTVASGQLVKIEVTRENHKRPLRIPARAFSLFCPASP
ncbi:MAG: sigma-54 factor interaction domain-containing protein [Desulfosudis oleivorans]|nr:sigma-54 factor interaction domain-containing protein [Desulfosudis oleivorans]